MADDSGNFGWLARAVDAALQDYSNAPALAILTIAVFSAIFLAWSASLSLRGLFQPIPGKPATFTIDVSGSTRSTKDSQKLSIVRLVVDGRRARPGDLILKGGWAPGWDSADRPVDPEGSDPAAWPRRAGWAARLNLPRAAGPASIAFVGRSAVVLFDLGNQCRALTISTETSKAWEDDCSASPRSTSSIVAVDLPTQATPSKWPFAFWLIISLAIVALVRPGIDYERTELWLIVYLALLHFLVWSTQCVGLIYDSLNQLPTLRFNAMGWPAYFPPGYPLVVGFGYLVSAAHAGSVITLIQHAMMVATILWCYRLLKRCVAQPLAYLTALTMGAAAPTLFLPQAIMSENVALFGMAGALYFAVCYARSDFKLHAIISGLLLGWAGMARIVPLAAGVPAILLLTLGAEPTMTGVKHFAAILAVTIGTIAIPVIWFGLGSGSFALANSLGHHLYNRVVTDQFLLDTSAPATARFLDLIEPAKPEGKVHWEIATLLKQKGLNYGEIDALMRQVSWEGICRSPWQFIVFSLRQSWTQYFHNPLPLVPWWSVPDKYTAELESVPLLGVHAGALLWRESLEQQFATAWTFLPWLGLAGLISVPFLRQRQLFLSFAVIPFGYIVSSAFVEFEYGRYAVAIIPFIYCLALGPFAAVTSIYWTKHSTPSR